MTDAHEAADAAAARRLVARYVRKTYGTPQPARGSPDRDGDAGAGADETFRGAADAYIRRVYGDPARRAGDRAGAG